MSGKLQNQLTLTKGKYYPLSMLCSECNDPLCCDAKHQNTCSISMSTSLQLSYKCDTINDKTTDTINDSKNPQVPINLDVNEQPMCRNTDGNNVTSVSQNNYMEGSGS